MHANFRGRQSEMSTCLYEHAYDVMVTETNGVIEGHVTVSITSVNGSAIGHEISDDINVTFGTGHVKSRALVIVCLDERCPLS